jgi:UDP-N-acetylmuramate dehydrogenase
MNILKNVPLKLHSTMRLGGLADYAVIVKKDEELAEAEAWAEARQLPVRVIGEGSNIIWRDEGFKGLLIVNKIKGIVQLAEDDESVMFQIGSGEIWDRVVAKLVAKNLSGIECLSLIPGTAGATPVQNVGAYGQEIAQVLVSLTAYDRMEKSFVTLTRDQCAFGYRTSRFKAVDNGRFLISGLTLKLNKSAMKPPFYEGVQKYLDAHTITDYSPKTIREAVIAIRSAKLPDPAKVANNGSFFANPIVDKHHYKVIKTAYKDVVAWETKDKQYKLSAAWLIEKAGFKGIKDAETGFATWPHQPLVLVNEKARSTNDLLKFQQKITDKVYEMFRINLEPEPELLP